VELYARAREGQPQAHTQRRPADKGRDDRTLTPDLHAVERDHIARMLAEAHGNKRAAAQRLGLSRRTLYRRLERYHLLDDSDPRP
jgi:transcriptional regulator with PAS, ATPase and Fis domain